MRSKRSRSVTLSCVDIIPALAGMIRIRFHVFPSVIRTSAQSLTLRMTNLFPGLGIFVNIRPISHSRSINAAFWFKPVFFRKVRNRSRITIFRIRTLLSGRNASCRGIRAPCFQRRLAGLVGPDLDDRGHQNVASLRATPWSEYPVIFPLLTASHPSESQTTPMSQSPGSTTCSDDLPSAAFCIHFGPR